MRRLGCLAVLALGMLAANCSGPSTATSQHTAMPADIVQRFKDARLGGTIATLQHTTATAERLVADPTTSPNDRQTVCSVLLLGVQQANGDLPAPADSALSSLLAAAYSELGAAATACGSATFDATTRTSFERARHRGLASLSEASARAEVLTGGPLSTSTTFPSDPSSAA